MEVNRQACPVLPVFKVMEKLGHLQESELYRTFNMGMGLVMVVPEEAVAAVKAVATLPVYQIGRVTAGDRTVRLS